LCADGKYKDIGGIVERKIPVEIISYDKNKGFIKNKVKIFHDNTGNGLLDIKFNADKNIICTEEHPILTKDGWKKAEKLKIGDLVAKIRAPIEFEDKSPYLYELLPKDKVYVQNKDNFFQKIIDTYRAKNNISAKVFSKEFGMPYSRFTDCRRLIGRKKSVRLDYFLKACELCEISKEQYLPYLKNIKNKGTRWPEWSLKLTEELMWLAGIIATDGCIVRSKKENRAEYFKIKLGNKSKVMIDKVEEIARKLDLRPYKSSKNNIFYIEFGSNILNYVFNSLGIPSKSKSYNLDITNNIFSLPRGLLYSYLEGIFEGDGNLNIPKDKKHGSIRIFSASRKFALGLDLILSRLGFESRVNKLKMKTSQIVKKLNGEFIYQVSLSRKEDLREFFENIPGYGEKALRGKRETKDYAGFLSTRKEYNKFLTYSEIIGIEKKASSERVYNLTLENEPNNFIVGNNIVHNCGRAGHRLHDTIFAKFVVMDRDDLVECCVMQKEIVERKINLVRFPKNCLDVLSQQIFGMAIYKIWKINEILELIRKSYCYSELSKEDFYSVISYLAGEYSEDLEKSNVYGKIWYDKSTGEIGKRGKLARVIYLTNIGTIPEESYIEVKLAPSGEHIGYIDEGFLERMKKGDVFVLGGARYMYLYTRGMNLYVKGSVDRPPTIPSWFSETLPLAFDSALEINRFRQLMKEKFNKKESKKEIIEFIKKYVYVDENTAEALYNYCYEQFRFSEFPDAKLITIERYKAEKNYIVVNSMYGRRVNDALSRALGWVMGSYGQRDIEIGISDNGFYFAGERLNLEKALEELKPENLKEILEEAINHTDILARRFRHCASRSLMILRNYKGRAKSVGKQQVKSHFLLHAVKKISKDFPILKEARREVLEDLMDIENAKLVLSWIKEKKVQIKIFDTKLPSPFSLGLILQGHSDLIRIEDKQDFLKRMHELHLKSLWAKDESVEYEGIS
jgi:hypothetical protein